MNEETAGALESPLKRQGLIESDIRMMGPGHLLLFVGSGGESIAYSVRNIVGVMSTGETGVCMIASQGAAGRVKASFKDALFMWSQALQALDMPRVVPGVQKFNGG